MDNEVEVRSEVRIAYCGAWLSRDDAEIYREQFFEEFGEAIEVGDLIIVEDTISMINSHHVVRILAENAQMEMELELE